MGKRVVILSPSLLAACWLALGLDALFVQLLKCFETQDAAMKTASHQAVLSSGSKEGTEHQARESTGLHGPGPRVGKRVVILSPSLLAACWLALGLDALFVQLLKCFETQDAAMKTASHQAEVLSSLPPLYSLWE